MQAYHRRRSWTGVFVVGFLAFAGQAGATPCTTDDQCPDDPSFPCVDHRCNVATGGCEAVGVTGCCSEDADCDDGNSCTNSDHCSLGPHTCLFPKDDNACPVGAFACLDTVGCDPSNPKAVAGSGCVYSKNDATCQDSVGCTDDGCDPDNANHDASGCIHSLNDEYCFQNVPCSEGCFPPSSTDATGCLPPSPDCCQSDGDCNDNIGCTLDECNQGTHLCQHSRQDPRCADGDLGDGYQCTTDVCNPGPDADPVTGCQPTRHNERCADGDLGDGYQCTTDVCNPGPDSDPTTGCQATRHDERCADGDLGDGFSCTSDLCVPGGADSNPTTGCQPTNHDDRCNDGNDCTSNECNPADQGHDPNGCVFPAIPNCGDMGSLARVSSTQKGSLLFWSKVELRWNAAGTLVQDTILSLTNDYPADVYVQLYFINGDPELDPVFSSGPAPVLIAEGEPGWNWVDCGLLLTPDQPVYWSAATGNPLGCQPFGILDPDLGGAPGRPDPEGSTDRVLRGFVVGWATDSAFANEVCWNHLSGKATLVNYANASAWEYNAWAFQSHVCTSTPGAAHPEPGVIRMNGVEYDWSFDMLLFDFFASGSMALSNGASVATVDTDLTLHVLDGDFRENSEFPYNPVTTKAHFDIWNMNERKLSNTRRCITCWDQTLISNYSAPNNMLLANLQSDKGKARINGLQANECEENCLRTVTGDLMTLEDIIDVLGDLFGEVDIRCSIDASLLGVAAKHIAFGAGGTDAAGSELVGMGLQGAVIRFDAGTSTPDSLRDEAYQRIGRDVPREAGDRKPSSRLESGPSKGR